jgi:DNA repair photolyase
MPYIYEPKGKAKEYGEYALNLYNGCTHGCRYCYVPAVMKKTPEAFHAAVTPRAFIWPTLEKEIRKHAGKPIFLCFTCDPYSAEDSTQTRNVINMIHKGDAFVNILTKAGARSVRDFDLLGEGDHYGATLTFINRTHSREWEPKAADPEERMDVLRNAHQRGIFTWASLEPVIDPAQSLEIINRCHEFVDLFKVGKWNHDARANAIDWKVFGTEAVRLLEKYGKKYYIKKDLAICLTQPGAPDIKIGQGK